MISELDRRAQLQSRLTFLRSRLIGIETELESHQARDWEDLAAEREGDEVLESVGLSGQQEIQMIEAALARIEAGEYGICTRCGSEIGEARLDVLPFTPFCSACAAELGARRHV
jgi:RNA polymerase-binding transcription factor DksA